MLQSLRRRRRHAGSVEVEPAIVIEISKGMAHAKKMWFIQPGTRHVCEFSPSVILVNINPCEIARDQQIERPVRIQIHERSRINSAIAFRPESRCNRNIPKIAYSVVDV